MGFGNSKYTTTFSGPTMQNITLWPVDVKFWQWCCWFSMGLPLWLFAWIELTIVIASNNIPQKIIFFYVVWQVKTMRYLQWHESFPVYVNVWKTDSSALPFVWPKLSSNFNSCYSCGLSLTLKSPYYLITSKWNKTIIRV